MTKCWVITEGLKGTENQCLALAEAVGLTPDIKIVKLKQPWKSVTPWIDHFSKKAFAAGSSEFKAPWPDLIIASGRKAIAPSLWIKRENEGRTKLVIVQSPVVKNDAFDLVVAPRHDNYKHGNVLAITGALSLINAAKLASAKTQWQSTFEKMPSPRVAVLVGGNSRTHTITRDIVKKLTMQLEQLLAKGHSVMVTASRRTPIEMQKKMSKTLSHPNLYFWDGSGDNPYQGMLAWADILLVTEDSVSMLSEAVSTGKPVYIIKMQGGSERFQRFYDYLFENDYARPFDGKIDAWTYLPPNDLDQAARKVKNLIDPL